MFYPFMDVKKIGFNKEFFIRCLSFVLGIILPMLFFFWYNKVFYTDLSNQGYVAQAFNSWLSHFPEGFLGIWLSPSKGILVYSPVIIFSLVGLYLSIKDILFSKKVLSPNLTYLFFGLIVLGHTFIMGFWKHWYGGYGFGYRMAGDVIPFLILLLIPFLVSKYFTMYRKIFYALVVFSILVQVYGLIFFDGIWHAAYDLGYSNTSWLWSLKDSEFMFNLRRVLVKIGLLSQACPKCL